MDSSNKKWRTAKLGSWFKRRIKHQKAPGPFHLSDVSDGGEDEGDDNLEDEDFFRSVEMESCISTNDLRVFVGSWNVAGRSPVGSLAVDLDDWLNLKDVADIYVLGFQEIVPLKTRTVIGAEDPTAATEWNMLIGKTLNDKYGCPWLTPMWNPIPSDNYYYSEAVPQTERRMSLSSRASAPIRDRSKTQNGQPADGCSKYKLMASKKMVGVFMSVWIKRELLQKYCISDVKVCSVACGIMGYLGNKGSVSVSMSIEGTSFCFIVAHLASGEKRGDEGRRNYQVSEIFRRTCFARLSQSDNNPLTILGHDRIFWFGDLNYRLCLEDNLARQLVKKQDWRALQEFDQLRKERDDGGVFQGWNEGNIEFAPTYKYSSSNCNRYSGGLPSRLGEKQRTPAWCDRILWYGKGLKQLSYFRSESKFSDHRPVSALFSMQIEVLSTASPNVVELNSVLPTITTPQPSQGETKGNEKAESTLLSLIVKDKDATPSFLQKA